MKKTLIVNMKNKKGVPAIALTPYKFRNENDAEGKFLLHSNILRVYGKLNSKGRYAEMKELKSYLHDIVEEKSLKWITIIPDEDECNCILFICGFGITPSGVRGFLNRKMNIERIELAQVEVKAFPVCGEQELKELVGTVIERKEFLRKDPAESGEQKEKNGEPAKEFALYGSYDKYDIKLYKIAGVNSSTYSLELVNKTPLSEQNFDKAVGEMIFILQSFESVRYKTIQEVVFSQCKLKQPYGRIVQSKKTRNKLAPKSARAEALQRIDREGHIPYSDLCALFSYGSSKKSFAEAKMAYKFIKTHNLLKLVENGIKIVKRQDMSVAV